MRGPQGKWRERHKSEKKLRELAPPSSLPPEGGSTPASLLGGDPQEKPGQLAADVVLELLRELIVLLEDQLGH